MDNPYEPPQHRSTRPRIGPDWIDLAMMIGFPFGVLALFLFLRFMLIE